MPTPTLPEPTVSTSITEYSKTEAALTELKQRYNGLVFDFSQKTGLVEAKKARTELRTLRTTLESMREDLKRPILERGRLIDAEAKRINERLLELETPLSTQIKAEEDRREKEKQEREAKQRLRINALQSRIDTLRNEPILAAGLPAAKVKEKLDEISALQIGTDFDEFQELAELVKAEVCDRLKDIFAAKTTAEREAEKIRQEREQLQRERAELEAQRAQQQVAIPSAITVLQTTATAAPLSGLISTPPIVPPVAKVPAPATVVSIPTPQAAPVVTRDIASVRNEITAALDTLDLDALIEVQLFIAQIGKTEPARKFG